MAQFSGVVNVQYPPAYEKFLAALSVVQLNLGSILSLLCVVKTNFYARLVLATIAPVAVLGVLAITYLVAMVRNGHSMPAMLLRETNTSLWGSFYSLSCTLQCPTQYFRRLFVIPWTPGLLIYAPITI